MKFEKSLILDQRDLYELIIQKYSDMPSFSQITITTDSLAWSYGARYSPPLQGCRGHKNCANCLTYALSWRQNKILTINGVQ